MSSGWSRRGEARHGVACRRGAAEQRIVWNRERNGTNMDGRGMMWNDGNREREHVEISPDAPDVNMDGEFE